MRVFLLGIFIWALHHTVAFAGDISAVEVKVDSASHASIVFQGQNFDVAKINVFQISGENPRVVIDIKDGTSPLLKHGAYTKIHKSIVRAIRAAQRNGNDIRFVIDLTDGSQFLDTSIQKTKISVTIAGSFQTSTPAIIQASNNPAPKIPVTNLPSQHDTSDIPTPRIKPKRKSKPIIVIDAGHGGRDPGALGGTGLQEKSVTLKAAKELQSQLQDTGRYKVVLSRTDDRYVEHDDRLRIARVNNADLFISIHADATAGKTARGASVYTLADRAKNRSRGIVNNQNWIMDVNLSEQNSDVGNILVDLAQRTTASQSTKFADILINNLGDTTPLIRNTHRRAGYYVLLAPDVPAVLLELGFISNPEDEKLLKSTSHRQQVMRSVTKAINQYFDTQKP